MIWSPLYSSVKYPRQSSSGRFKSCKRWSRCRGTEYWVSEVLWFGMGGVVHNKRPGKTRFLLDRRGWRTCSLFTHRASTAPGCCLPLKVLYVLGWVDGRLERLRQFSDRRSRWGRRNWFSVQFTPKNFSVWLWPRNICRGSWWSHRDPERCLRGYGSCQDSADGPRGPGTIYLFMPSFDGTILS